MEALIWTLIVGAVVGWLAGALMKTGGQMGVLANIIVGIVGAAIGGWIFGVLGLAAYGLVGRLIMYLTGAVVLIAILKALRVYK
jgi:uncharacterized membrane protein YeaQ/YmgE (transglycosylase-associated protein family)